MISSGWPNRGCRGSGYGCAGQGAYVSLWRCPGGAARVELVMLMGSDGTWLFRGEGMLIPADA